ncbi:hypothetical protein JMM61_19585 [Rhodovulum sulfidophilum]|uniref:P-loop ATPase, Sll1717 family n=3 Tax=Rhodovulum sulfidophilum TaxID=35806 RepID=UPI0019287E11|nr:hypothetical protein [Rhodovulum sulfidophilum]MBL3587538.1 hypothetical protein [Rhodovulum sulfidophilum]
MAGIDKRAVLESLDIGNGVAERERAVLKDFFLESSAWRKLRTGNADLVFGPKGSGKSTLFFNVIEHEYDLLEEGILIVSSENTAGESVFSAARQNPPENEEEYIAIWKLYILALIVDRCSKDGLNFREIKAVEQLLTQEGIYKKGRTISGFFSSVVEYVKSRLNFNTAEGEVEIDPATGIPKKLKGKFTFAEPSESGREKGLLPISDALMACSKFLLDERKSIWILVDRLDVIFANDKKAEALALRALFRVYGEMHAMPAIKLKIFLRDDIWRDITRESGFREASHLIKKVSISWEKIPLANLLIQRLVASENFRIFYRLPNDFLRSTNKNKMGLINSLFPRQMNLFGEGTERAFDWLIIHTRDGKDINTPRDLIELLNFAKDFEIDRLVMGERPYRAQNLLFNHEGLSKAGGQLSALKMEQTVFAEHPDMRQYIDAFFESIPRNFDIEKLCALWSCDEVKAKAVSAKLADIGFFKVTGRYRYLIPVLFTHYLGINPSKKKFDR